MIELTQCIATLEELQNCGARHGHVRMRGLETAALVSSRPQVQVVHIAAQCREHKCLGSLEKLCVVRMVLWDQGEVSTTELSFDLVVVLHHIALEVDSSLVQSNVFSNRVIDHVVQILLIEHHLHTAAKES